jgi:hypothetical protein
MLDSDQVTIPASRPAGFAPARAGSSNKEILGAARNQPAHWETNIGATLLLGAGIRGGRKGVKLATTILSQKKLQS